MSIFDFFNRKKTENNNQDNINNENMNQAAKENFFNLLAKAINKEISQNEMHQLLLTIVNSSLQSIGCPPVDIVYTKNIKAPFEDGITAMQYVPLMNAININLDYLDMFYAGKIEFTDVLVSLLHEKRHAFQFANLTKKLAGTEDDELFQYKHENKIEEIISKTLKDKNFQKVALEWADAKFRIENNIPDEANELETMKNFYMMFNSFFEDKDLQTFFNDVCFGFYLNKADEIDARKWGFIETSMLIEAIQQETVGQPFYQDWCKKQIDVLQQNLHDEEKFIDTYVANSKNYYNVDISKDFLLTTIRSIEEALAKMTINDIEKGYNRRDFRFRDACEECLKMLFKSKDFETLTNYFFAIKYSGAYKHVVTEKEVSFYGQPLGEEVLFKMICEQLANQPKQTQAKFRTQLLNYLILNGKDFAMRNYLKILTQNERKQLAVRTESGLDSELSNEFANFNVDDQNDRALVKKLLERFDENYNVYSDENAPYSERLNQAIKTQKFGMNYFFDVIQEDSQLHKLMERFGYAEEFNKILERPNLYRELDDQIKQKIEEVLKPKRNLTHQEYLRMVNGELEPILPELPSAEEYSMEI